MVANNTTTPTPGIMEWIKANKLTAVLVALVTGIVVYGMYSFYKNAIPEPVAIKVSKPVSKPASKISDIKVDKTATRTAQVMPHIPTTKSQLL